MDAAPIDLPPSRPRLDHDRLRDMVLVRVATAGRPIPRETVARDLAPVAADLLPADAFGPQIERDLAALANAGLVDLKPTSAGVTEAGEKRAAILIGGRIGLPKTWPEARDVRLVARALGLENEALKKLKSLARPDGLRAAIVTTAFKLKVRGHASPVRLRSALAKVALARVFTGDDAATVQRRSGLSAKDERTLAARLAKTQKTFRTDAQLIATLAAEQVGSDGNDLAALQIAVLRRSIVKVGGPAPMPVARPKRRITPIAAVVAPPTAAPTVPPPPAINARPTLVAFAADVLALAAPVAEGFTGNRKAFISRLWRSVTDARAHWGLTEIEFKAMLTEAHRTGHLVLANADLKDDRNLRDVQDSAVTYRNAVFHFVRVDT